MVQIPVLSRKSCVTMDKLLTIPVCFTSLVKDVVCSNSLPHRDTVRVNTSRMVKLTNILATEVRK